MGGCHWSMNWMHTRFPYKNKVHEVKTHIIRILLPLMLLILLKITPTW